MKKILPILLCLALVFAFAACDKTPAATDSAAAAALEEMFSALKAGKFDDTDILEGSAFGNEDATMLEGIFAKFDYKLGEVTENGDTATVAADITMVDMGALFSAYLTEAMAHIDDAEWDADGSYFAEMAKMDSAATKDFTAVVQMVKGEDGVWTVAEEGNEALYNALTGGLVDSLGGLENMLGE